MKSGLWIVGVIAAVLMGILVGRFWSNRPGPGETIADAAPAARMVPHEPPHVIASSPVQAGRYLVLAGGCNDCHTPGWMQVGDTVPEALWLTGVPVGWRGPWGTTYASNLRLAIAPFTADQFIEAVRKRNARPPMPWTSLHAMSDEDLHAVYAYIKSLGPAGVHMPDVVPPDRTPKGPYLSLMPQGLPTTQPAAPVQ